MNKKALLHFANTLPTLNPTRIAILASLQDEIQVDWSAILRTRKFLDTDVEDDAQDYIAQVNLLKRLKSGDTVEIVWYQGGSKKVRRAEVDMSWHDLKSSTGKNFKPTVTLVPTKQALARPGGRGGMISDYGSAVYWQPTMMTQVMEVVRLRKV
jgi:hypothetical protein